MPSPTSGGTFSIIPATGVRDIDALISTGRWGVSSSSPTVITYSFPGYGGTFSINPTSGYGPSSGTGHPWNGFAPLTTYQQQQVRAVLQSISNVANIVFQEVSDDATSAGDIRYAFSSSVSSSSAASAFLPGGTYSLATNIGTATAKAGDVWINSSTYRSFNPVSGSFDYTVLLHETMHALGLKHPFEAGETGVVLPTDRNVIPMTLMSYDEGPGTDSFLSVYPAQPMSLDVSALQYLYGANRSANAGDNTYTQNTDNPTWLEIWDTGGNDTIVLSGYRGATLDLQPNSWSKIGNGIDIGYTSTWAGTLYIEPNVTIENAVGGSGNDTITGNDANNSLDGGGGNDILYGGAGNDTFDWDASLRGGNDVFYGGAGNDIYVLNSSSDTIVEYANEGADTVYVSFSYSLGNLPNIENLRAFGSTGVTLTGNAAENILDGGGGNDTINGGAGIDWVIYSNNRTSYSITKTSTGFNVSGSADGTDTLTNIERLYFPDKAVALDINGNAGSVAKILGAVFGAASVSNKQYVGIGLSYLDDGTTYQNLALLALNARLGVGFSNTAEVNLLYQNLLGVLPSAADLNNWTRALSSGQYSQASLAVMAADTTFNATNINLVGLVQTGIEYS